MKIAIPVIEHDEFSPHYGGATRLACFDVDRRRRAVLSRSVLTPPSDEPCSWPEWIHAQGIDLVLAGGMGSSPRRRLEALGVAVRVGVRPASPAQLVEAFLHGRLAFGANACEESHHGHHHGETCGCAH